MASAGSKGLTKRHSPLQKEHYKSHPHRLEKNKRARVLRHIRRNLRKVVKAAKQGRKVAIDEQALRCLKVRGGDPDSIKREELPALLREQAE